MRANSRPHHRIIVLSGTGLMLVLLAWLVAATATSPLDSFAQCALAGYTVSDTNPPICDDSHTVYLGPVASATPAPVAVAAQDFELLVDGDSHSNYPRGWQVITTQADWVKYWSAVHAALPTLPPLLPVDFSRLDVVALSEGHEPTSGYSLKITEIAAGPGGSVVDITESFPTITCTVTPDPPTNRYYIVDTAKLSAPVSFRLTSEPRQC